MSKNRKPKTRKPQGGETVAYPALLTQVQLAEYLGIPERTVETWRYNRTLQSGEHGPDWIKLGKHVRYPQPLIAAWIESQMHAPAS